MGGSSGCRDGGSFGDSVGLMGGRDPLYEFLTQVDRMFQQMMAGLDEEIAHRIEEALASDIDPTDRGATWTYLTQRYNPLGNWTDRIRKRVARGGHAWVQS